MDEILQRGSAALKKAALSIEAKNFLLENDQIQKLMRKAADRYIAGATLEEALIKVENHSHQGLKCSLEFMGESTLTEKETEEATLEFLRIAEAIKNLNLNATISLDLSHIGLAISKALALNNLNRIAEAASKAGIEVIVSAESEERTDAIIDTYQSAARNYDNLAITLQAYLHRSEEDFKTLIQSPGRIRVVKGAFEMPASIALPRGTALNDRYLGFVDQLLASIHLCSIATHHDLIQEEAKKMIVLHRAKKENYEFESLYGIQTDNLLALKSEGYPTKLYFVYGKEWYLYVLNRLSEYPLNVFRALEDLVN